MWPIPYFLLRFLLSCAGAVFGGWLGGAVYDSGLLQFLGAVAAFFGVYLLWVRLVPIRCPSCGGTMTEMGERGSRRINFTCNSCGRMQ